MYLSPVSVFYSQSYLIADLASNFIFAEITHAVPYFQNNVNALKVKAELSIANMYLLSVFFATRFV